MLKTGHGEWSLAIATSVMNVVTFKSKQMTTIRGDNQSRLGFQIPGW